MARKKRGILRREIILVDGKEIAVDTFDAKVILGSGKELESIDASSTITMSYGNRLLASYRKGCERDGLKSNNLCTVRAGSAVTAATILGEAPTSIHL